VPVEYGGRGEPFDPVAEWTILDEFLDAGAPPLPLQSTGVVHALLKHGTAPQRDAYIRATLEGRLRWCQGFSEPDAGSDLANLRSRADLDGDAWILNGQKIWTSSAIEADMMFGLFRTERDVPGGRGISYLLVPMDLPGITVRPIRQMTGPDEFNEVFFDDVRCPTANLVGERGGGWSVVRSALSYERIGFGNPRQLRRGVDSLVAMARRFGVDGRRPGPRRRRRGPAPPPRHPDSLRAGTHQ
jgi:alkylation response protein AidB-like acyl-CoA dehydrogenase